jgi:fluoroquinolone transport system permease protein
VHRIAAAARLELRVELRYRIVAVAAVLCAVWTLLLLLIPEPAARVLGPPILLLDTATFGAFFVAALFLFERGEGALAALLTSPLRSGEYLVVKLTTLTGLSLAASVPIALAAGRGRLGDPADLPGLLAPVLLGVGLAAVLILTLSFALVLASRSLTGYLATAPPLLIPRLATPLAHVAGIVEHPLAYAVPTTGAVDLIRMGIAPGAAGPPPAQAAAMVAYLVLWIALAIPLARRRFDREFTRPREPRPATASTATASRRPARAGGWIATFARVDLRSIRMERLLVLVLAAPVLLAIAIRLGHRPLLDLLADRFGVDLSPYGSLLLALLVVVHLPIIIGMTGSMLVLDDVDERRLLLFRVTPVTLERYLAYRVVSTALVTFAGLLVTVPMSGLGTAPLPALLLAAAQAPLIVLAVAAFAGNKVQGLALLKLLSGLVMLAASTAWLVAAPVRWVPLLLPPASVTYVQRAAEAGDGLGVLAGAAAGAAATAVAGGVLMRRAIQRATT